VRLLEVVVVLVFLAGSLAIVRAGMRAGARREIDSGPWEPVHRFEDGVRRVYVGRGAVLEPVGEVVPSDPQYDDAFLALMDRARERAAVLNSERSG
jgi:hypothetical protein